MKCFSLVVYLPVMSTVNMGVGKTAQIPKLHSQSIVWPLNNNEIKLDNFLYLEKYTLLLSLLSRVKLQDKELKSRSINKFICLIKNSRFD